MQLILGPLAKRMRMDMGLKQGTVAQEIGTSSGNLCRFENGQQGLSQPLLTKLTAILNTTTEELIAMNSTPNELKDLVLMMSNLSEAQLEGVKGFVAAMNLSNKNKDASNES